MPQRVAFDGESIPAKKCGFEKVNRGVAVGGSSEKEGKVLFGHEPLELPAGELFFSGYLVTSRD
jgi:hypothetical protein